MLITQYFIFLQVYIDFEALSNDFFVSLLATWFWEILAFHVFSGSINIKTAIGPEILILPLFKTQRVRYLYKF